MSHSLQSFFATHSTNKANIKVAVYVPSLSSGMPTATQAELLVVVRNFLVTRLGGCTHIPANGFYEDKAMQTFVAERVDYYYAFTEVNTLGKHAADFKRLANAICVEFAQTEVAVEVGDTLYFYSPSDSYKEEYLKRRKEALAGGNPNLFLSLLEKLS